MFQPVDAALSFHQQEEEVCRFWKERRIYEKSLELRSDGPAFVFYEGPPTANGLPHPGHCLTRAIKDLFPRYRTMRGYRCERKGGWDTHGLPVEVEVCKELGIHSKEQIEEYGVEPFIHKCLQSVFRYTKEWEQLTERLGFWIHLDEAYVTYHQSYVESVWWALKTLFDRGLLYRGHKIVWWWAQGGTALSSGEVGEGYREVADPSVYVRFPLVDEPDTDLLVWTTTPWTLPGNQFVAVNPRLSYAYVSLEGEPRRLLVATELVETIAEKTGKTPKVRKHVNGRSLLRKRYRPPFDCFHSKLGHITRELYRPQPHENWADYPLLYAHNVLRLSGQEADRWLKDNSSRPVGWHIVPGDFVTTDTGTGIVHVAPAFGEDDFEILKREKELFGPKGDVPPLLCPVAPNGNFSDEAPDYAGRWLKDCDRDIIRELTQRDLLYHQEQYLHDYPFCPRAEEDPLIQYPRRSWFVRTTEFKDQMLANNRQINWLPEHIRDGRFGNFLEANVDWALSRERYWGTPLPIWVCEQTGYMEAVASYEELLAKPGATGTEAWEQAKRKKADLPDDLRIHKPYIDEVTYDSPKAKGARMRRVSEVIDCWFDAGAMPFAQWGHPRQEGSQERFNAQFPADFISEALDQTRGWFYSLLAISTLLFGRRPMSVPEILESPHKEKIIGTLADPVERVRNVELVTTPHPQTVDFPHPFRNCIVLGLLLGDDGEKMSKRKRNYPQPSKIFDRYGADAMRWYFFANQPPWTTIRFSERAIKQCIPEFLLRLWNVYSFFVIYANIDQFDPAGQIAGDPGQLTPEILAAADGYLAVAERGELDRWILSELGRTAAAVAEAMDAYDNYTACTRLSEFLDALSNWYVRRSRSRFWTGQESADKTNAHWTLYECLITTCKLIAPFVPFLAEAIWQNLAVAAFSGRAVESVHLCDYPTPDADAIDEELSERMALVREIASLGRSARMSAKLKVRQPLSQVEVVLADSTHKAWLEEHAALICKELNVKSVEIIEKADQYITYTILPDLKRLGPRLGKRLPALRKRLGETDAGRLLAQLESEGRVSLELPDGPVDLDRDDLLVRLEAKQGWTAAQGRLCVVVLSTDLTDELLAEGLAREVVHAIQNRRRDLGCEYTDRIRVGIVTGSKDLRAAVEQFADYVKAETLAVEITFAPLPGAEPAEVKLAGYALTLYVEVVSVEPS
ncbi:MAG: isoleucine--tRNA ligase [Planctomycetota bacterium]|jgi:isoleucyl-tRNA synthetase